MPVYSRSEKGSHLDTIQYEIDMLQLSLSRYRHHTAQSEQGDKNAFIETFLLHYRNLLEFFAGDRPRKDDLSTDEPQIWAGRGLTPEETRTIQEPGRALRDSQPNPNSKLTLFEIISKYLQHCTTLRHERSQSWDLERMYADLRPVIVAFQRSFLPKALPPMTDSGCGTSNSTATVVIRR